MSRVGMTNTEAIAEAQRRWGNGHAVMLPLVGCVVVKGTETMGSGRTWEAAFADASEARTLLADESKENAQ